MEAEFTLLQRAVTVVLNLALCALVGSSAALLWLRSAHSAWAAALRPRVRSCLLAAVGIAIAAHVALLWVEAASMAEVPLADALPAVGSVLAATHYGLAWMIGAAALLVIAAVSAAGVQVQAGGACALRIAAIGVLLYSRSMVSHAGAGGDFTWAVLVDWLHLVLTTAWVGAVLVAGLLVLRRLPDHTPASRTDCGACIEALSRSATVALCGIVATGAISAWRVLAGPQDLVGNPYGSALLVKVGLVLCAAALGGFNRFFVMPSLLRSLHRSGHAETVAGHRFARVLQAEALVLIAVIVAAAVLTSTSPPLAS